MRFLGRGEALHSSTGRCFVLCPSSVRPKYRAFTLLEVLLAVAVFAIILLAMHGVFHGALRLRQRTTEAMDRAVPLQQALAIIKRDLAGIVMPGGTLFGEFQTTPTTSTLGSQSQFTSTTSGQSSSTPTRSGQSALSPAFYAFNDISMRGRVVSPALYTAVGLVDDLAPWGEVQRVIYYLAQPTNDAPGLDLMRSVSRNLLPVLQEELVDQWVLNGVEDVAFTYYDGQQWQLTWDSSLLASNKLPQAVKVELLLTSETTDRRSQQDPITLVVPLWVQGMTNTTTTTTATGGGQ
jgi:prepilin-type N-terminal cleavage/methylation domain-containing protein